MPAKRKKASRKPAPKKTSRTRKPDNMSVEEWQTALRREFGREQDFVVRNTGSEALFSEYAVTNPKTSRTYRVAIRGKEPGVNYCSCPDFSVNTLGTCKHVEWLLARLERKSGAKRAFREGFQPAYSEVYLQYGVQRRVRFCAGQSCPRELRKLAADYFDDGGWLRPDAAARFDQFVRQASAMPHEVRIYEDAIQYVARLRDDERRCAEIAARFEGKGAAARFKHLLKVNLYPYQQRGALFAAKAGRCLLADDMGLGKTIQAIAAVEILARTAGVEHVLIVCPTALKYQWKQEIERFTERTALVVEGFTHERRRQYATDAFFKIVNYEILHRDLEDINARHPDVLILDEAQRIKNWDTRRAKSVKQIDANFAIVLTGTPLENRLGELHSIMEVVDRFRLGPLFRFLHEHQHTDDSGRVVGYKQLNEIKNSLASVLIRRRKNEVLLELPERTDKHFFVDMTEQQRVIHDENRDIVVKLVAKWRRWGFLSEKDQRRLMVALQYMRMACNSTYLIDKTTEHGGKIDECAALLGDVLEAPGTKAVVFSQWLGTHDLLLRHLNGTSSLCAFYHGSLDGKQRRAVLDRFKNSPDCRVLLCTDSGGVGLNLQFASCVINMDQPWNPAVLEQRIGRVHRLGQHRSVQVYHFVARDTIEHSMLDVLKFKSAMFQGVLDGGESEIFLGGSQMKKFMETVERVTETMPEHVPTQEETQPEDPLHEDIKENNAGSDREVAEPTSATEPIPSALPIPDWNKLLASGLEFITKLSQKTAAASSPAARIVHDSATGAPELRVSLPDEDTARQLGAFLSGLGALLGAVADRAAQ